MRNWLTSSHSIDRAIVPLMHPFRFFLALAAGLLFATAAFAAEPQVPPGARVGLVPPQGMTASACFQGFEDRERGALLAVIEFSAQTFDKVAESFSPEQMRAGGMKELS